MMHAISLGAGVQSTTMALMAAHGEIGPMPDCAIFADTGAEPAGVYRHLQWLMSGILPFPVHVVSAGNLRDHVVQAMSGDMRMDARPPFFNESGGPVNRQCTQRYKINPIRKKLKELVDVPKRKGDAPLVEQWIGISLDEAMRMKHSRDWWQVNRWPLIERRMSRYDCLGWLDRHGYTKPPKSACTFCPFRNTEAWRAMKATDPVSWADAVEIDRLIRPGPPQQKKGGRWFVHYSTRPLEEIDFSTAEDRGQLNLFLNECEGLCGV